MKRFTVLFLFISLSFNSFSRKTPPTDTVTASAIPNAAILLNDIMRVTGLKQNFELKEAAVMNIEASIEHKKRYIYYNPVFINSLNAVSKNKWAVTTLLAHEVGHHLNGHTMRKTGSNKQVELEADEFAGFVLNKMGASLEEAQQVMLYVAKKEDSKTHPARGKRMDAIAKGWNNASLSDHIH